MVGGLPLTWERQLELGGGDPVQERKVALARMKQGCASGTAAPAPPQPAAGADATAAQPDP
eukprot:1144735-Prymnesium_polylepis.1